MAVTNLLAGTRIDEIADGIYRISTVVADGAFTHNQYLLLDDEPLLFHTGHRRLFQFVHEAVETVVPFARVRHLAFSHFEADECGALNQMLVAAPHASAICSRTCATINGDSFDRPARGVTDGEILSLGERRVRWIDAPHLPHAWECGYFFEETTRTLLCGDLFTQGGGGLPPITTTDILGPSEAMRRRVDYYSHSTNTRTLLDRLAGTHPTTLACMHGSAWAGDGAALLHALAHAIERSRDASAGA